MKKIVIILALIFSVASFAQTGSNEAKTTVETTEIKKDEKVSTFKVEALEINQKKSNDIISIKAYRKSLNVKVSTKKLC